MPVIAVVAVVVDGDVGERYPFWSSKLVRLDFGKAPIFVGVATPLLELFLSSAESLVSRQLLPSLAPDCS